MLVKAIKDITIFDGLLDGIVDVLSYDDYTPWDVMLVKAIKDITIFDGLLEGVVDFLLYDSYTPWDTLLVQAIKDITIFDGLLKGINSVLDYKYTPWDILLMDQIDTFLNGSTFSLERFMGNVQKIFNTPIKIPKFDPLSGQRELVKGKIEEVFGGSTDIFPEIGDSVEALVKILERAFQGILKFGEKVVGVFEWAYIEIVGNSWWPDTIDEVVAYTDGLRPALSDIVVWGRNVVNTFAKTFRDVAGATAKVGGSIFSDLYDVGSITLTVINSTKVTDTTSALIAAAVVFSDELVKGLDYLKVEYPRAFSLIATSLAARILLALSGVPAALTVAIGGALANGIDAGDIVRVAREFIEVIAIGIGRAIGAFIANIPFIIPAFIKAFYQIGVAMGDAILSEIPFIGAALKAGMLPVAELFVGAIAAKLVLVNFGKFFFGEKFNKGAKAAFGFIAKKAKGMYDIGKAGGTAGGMISNLLFGEGGEGGGLKDYALSFNVVKDAVVKMKEVFNAGPVQKFIAALMGTNAPWVLFIVNQAVALRGAIATALSLNGLSASLALTTIATRITGGAFRLLTATLVFAKVAANQMWLAILGPIGKVIAILLLLKLAFGSMTANAATGMEEVAAATNGWRDTLRNLVGEDYQLNIKVVVDDADPESVDDAVDELNTTILEAAGEGGRLSGIEMGREINNGLAFVLNGPIDVLNAYLDKTGLYFIKKVGKFTKDTRTATEILFGSLQDVEPVGLKLDAEFVGEDAFNVYEGLLRTANESIRLRVDAENASFTVGEKSLALLRQQETNNLNAVDIFEKQNKILQDSGKYLKQRNEYLLFGNEIEEETAALFGDSLIKARSASAVAALTLAQQKSYNNALNQAAAITAKIREIAATDESLLNEEEKKELIGQQLRLYEGQQYVIDNIGKTLDVMSRIDLAKSLGFDDTVLFKLDEGSLALISEAQGKVEQASAALESLRDKPGVGAEEIETAQRGLNSLEAAAETTFESISRGFNTTLGNLIEDLSLGDVNTSLQDLSKLSEPVVGDLTQMAAAFKALDDALKTVDSGSDAEANLKAAMARLAVQGGKFYGEALADTSITNFERALKPFNDIGSSFDLDAFKELGKTGSAAMLASAAGLAKGMDDINATAFTRDIDRLEAVAAFNQKIFAFEEEIRKAREDALKGERDAAKLAGTLSGGIMEVLRGDTSIGDLLKNTIFNSLQTGLQERLNSFFVGLFESIFDNLEGSEGGAGNFLAGLLTGPDNKEKDKLEGKGASVATAIQEDGVAGALEEGASSFKGVFSGFSEGFKGILGSFSSGFSSIISGIGSALSGLFGGGSGGGGLLGGLAGFFHTGGLVPDNGGYSKLNGGEMVLTEAQQGQLFASAQGRQQGGGQSTVNNINVTGDISRQTQKEILKMLPTISGGVNQFNRENRR